MKIRELMAQDKTTLSFEVFPPKKDTDFANVEKAAFGIAQLKPSYMSVTYGAGGSTKGHTIRLAGDIQKKFSVPTIAHLTCVCATKESIEQALSQMKEAGIENILALRGDVPKDFEGNAFTDFTHASELVKLIKENGDFCVGGACYPEIHPESANRADDLLHLKEKVDSGVNFLLTQMFFNNEKFYEFRNLADKKGIHIPISAGIMPITSARQLGTSVSLSGTSIPPALSSIVAKYTDNPEDLRKAGLDYAVNQINDLLANDVDGIHIYTMNHAATASYIMKHITRK